MAGVTKQPPTLQFISRRSPVYSTHGMVATSQPLASEIGLRVLRDGGNAADAAIAIAAALNVTEPCSTGIGGDCFALFFNAETKQVEAMNGSGRSPQALTLQIAKDSLDSQQSEAKAEQGPSDPLQLPNGSVHCVTVPGTAAGWADCVSRWGRLPLSEVLQPAIALAEEGFPVSPITAHSWEKCLHQLQRGPHAEELLVDGKPPVAGQLFRNPGLARTFRELAEGGPDAFYKGRAGEEIVRVLSDLGGVMSMEDLASHRTEFTTPISVDYKGTTVYEAPPNGQGLTALLALQTLSGMEVAGSEGGRDGDQYLHTLIEAMRVAFADARWFIADMEHSKVPLSELLNEEYAATRRALIDSSRATVDVQKGSPISACDTVSFQVVDGDGNAVSFVNSNFEGFGSGLIPKGCGFTLQNRGHGFYLSPPHHPNVLAPGKRPYHTIIPGMTTQGGELHCSFTVMGGYMQPQGHIQILLNMLEWGDDPQTALDRPRFCISTGLPHGTVCLEDGIPEQVVAALAARGHSVRTVASYDRSVFGRGQIIVRHPATGVLCAGSDSRADGLAIGW